MIRLAKLLTAGALAAGAVAAGASSASAGVDPTLNHPATYEQGGAFTCTKVEYADGLKDFQLPVGASFAVIKTGTEYTTVYDRYPWTFEKDISFIITCTPNYS